MLRGVLALTAGVGCGLIGLRRASGLVQRERELQAWVDTLHRLSLLLAEQTLTLPQVFEHAGFGCAAHCLCQTAEKLRQTPACSPQQAFQTVDAHALCWATAEEKERLLRMMAGIGRGGVALRKQAVDQAADWFALALSKAQLKRKQDARLALTLGWTAGACLALMLL